MISSSSNYSVSPIGFVHSPYKQKFGIARQPGLVPSAQGFIQLLPEYSPDCVRDLDQYDYIWVHFIFHHILDKNWSPLIKPPKLGGDKKVGVFATRSPHRPNHLGLSLIKLENIKIDVDGCVNIYLSGIDLLDGTPIIDIKPYLPFIEAKPFASNGFTQEQVPLNLSWSGVAEQKKKLFNLTLNECLLIEQSLIQDPRPVHQHNKNKTFVVQLMKWEIYFSISENDVFIIDISEY